MSDQTPDTKPKAAGKTAEAKPQHRSPEQDAKDAKKTRQEAEDKKAAENQELIDAGKVVAQAPIYGYDHARAQLHVDEADKDTPVDTESTDSK